MITAAERWEYPATQQLQVSVGSTENKCVSKCPVTVDIEQMCQQVSCHCRHRTNVTASVMSLST